MDPSGTKKYTDEDEDGAAGASAAAATAAAKVTIGKKSNWQGNAFELQGLWQYRLWSFQGRDIKLEWFLV